MLLCILRIALGCGLALLGGWATAATPDPRGVPAEVTWTPGANAGTRTFNLGPAAVTFAGKADAEVNISFAAAGTQGAAFSVDAANLLAGSPFHVRADRLDPEHSRIDVMVLWYTGGAHCCTGIKVASLLGEMWKIIDLGMWDGEPDGMPKPRVASGGGKVLPMGDNDFLYAFSSYAGSGTPLKLLRIENGAVVDVSADPRYRPWFPNDMVRWQRLCTDRRQSERFGVCAAYAASAARAGVLSDAWKTVVQNAGDGAFSFCEDWRAGKCQKDVKFAHYPEALRWFLRKHGYPAQ